MIGITRQSDQFDAPVRHQEIEASADDFKELLKGKSIVAAGDGAPWNKRYERSNGTPIAPSTDSYDDRDDPSWWDKYEDGEDRYDEWVLKKQR